MTAPSKARTVRKDQKYWSGLGLLVVAAAAIWWALRSGLDFKVYWYAAKTVITDPSHLYDPMLGPLYNPGLPFTYPPFAAAIFAPLAYLDQRAGIVIFALYSVAAAWVLVYKILRGIVERENARVGALVAAAWFLLIIVSGPYRDTIIYGQINIFLLIVITYAVYKLGWSFWTGFIIGVCGGIKLTPLALILAPLAKRDFVTCSGVVCGFGATVGVGFALIPNQSVEFWFTVLRDPSRVGGLDYVDNVSLKGVLARFGIDGTAEWVVLSSIFVVMILILIAKSRTTSNLQMLAVAALAMLVVSPVTWSHHWVWFPLVAVAWSQIRLRYGLVTRRIVDFEMGILGIYLLISPKLLIHLLGYDADQYVPVWLTHLSDIPVFASVAVITTLMIASNVPRPSTELWSNHVANSQ